MARCSTTSCRMRPSRFPRLILIVAAVGSVSCSSEVRENRSSYPCCGEGTIKFNQQCESIFNVNNTPIAYFKGSSKSCIPPCSEIESGVMTLDKCLDVNLTMVCHHGNLVHFEYRISHSSQGCPDAPSNKMGPLNQGSVALLLLLVIGGFLVK